MTIGFICGAWDLLHPGHLDLLRQCKKQCDYLKVGLHTDPSVERITKNKPIQTTYERYVQLYSCEYVDEVIPYDTERDLENLLKTDSINIRFNGADHKYSSSLKNKICEEHGIKLIYIPRDHDWSSTELRSRLK